MSSHLNFPYPHAGIGRPLAQRWCALAESRLDYLTELFESGRWRRFHSEAEFLDNIQEAKDAVERWRLMVEGETAAVRRVLSSEGVIYRAPRAPNHGLLPLRLLSLQRRWLRRCSPTSSQRLNRLRPS